jgi:hypothetical protein
MKKIEDYLHLYIGQKCLVDGTHGRLNSVSSIDGTAIVTFGINGPEQDNTFFIDDVQLILRPLADMKEEEFKELLWNPAYIHSARIESYTPKEFLYLLKQGLDLFELIPNNLAIDKTKMK